MTGFTINNDAEVKNDGKITLVSSSNVYDWANEIYRLSTTIVKDSEVREKIKKDVKQGIIQSGRVFRSLKEASVIRVVERFDSIVELVEKHCIRQDHYETLKEIKQNRDNISKSVTTVTLFSALASQLAMKITYFYREKLRIKPTNGIFAHEKKPVLGGKHPIASPLIRMTPDETCEMLYEAIEDIEVQLAAGNAFEISFVNKIEKIPMSLGRIKYLQYKDLKEIREVYQKLETLAVLGES